MENNVHSATTEEPESSEYEVKTPSLPRVYPNGGGGGSTNWCITEPFRANYGYFKYLNVENCQLELEEKRL